MKIYFLFNLLWNTLTSTTNCVKHSISESSLNYFKKNDLLKNVRCCSGSKQVIFVPLFVNFSSNHRIGDYCKRTNYWHTSDNHCISRWRFLYSRRDGQLGLQDVCEWRIVSASKWPSLPAPFNASVRQWQLVVTEYTSLHCPSSVCELHSNLTQDTVRLFIFDPQSTTRWRRRNAAATTQHWHSL